MYNIIRARFNMVNIFQPERRKIMGMMFHAQNYCFVLIIVQTYFTKLFNDTIVIQAISCLDIAT